MANDLRELRRRSELLARLCVRGSNDLAEALYRRLVADRRVSPTGERPAAPTWGEVVDRAASEGLLAAEDRDVLIPAGPWDIGPGRRAQDPTGTEWHHDTDDHHPEGDHEGI